VSASFTFFIIIPSAFVLVPYKFVTIDSDNSGAKNYYRYETSNANFAVDKDLLHVLESVSELFDIFAI